MVASGERVRGERDRRRAQGVEGIGARITVLFLVRLPDGPGWRLRARDGAPLQYRLHWIGLNRPQAEVLQAQWGKFGAEVEVQGTVDAAFTRQRRADNDWEAFIEQWNTVGDIAVVLHRHVEARQHPQLRPVPRRPARFAPRRLQQSLVDADARRNLALQINACQAEVVPFVPIVSQGPPDRGRPQRAQLHPPLHAVGLRGAPRPVGRHLRRTVCAGNGRRRAASP